MRNGTKRTVPIGRVSYRSLWFRKDLTSPCNFGSETTRNGTKRYRSSWFRKDLTLPGSFGSETTRNGTKWYRSSWFRKDLTLPCSLGSETTRNGTKRTRWARWTVLGCQDAIVTFQDGTDWTYNLFSRFLAFRNMHYDSLRERLQ